MLSLCLGDPLPTFNTSPIIGFNGYNAVGMEGSCYGPMLQVSRFKELGIAYQGYSNIPDLNFYLFCVGSQLSG